MKNIQVTLICVWIAVLQAYFFKLLTIQESILVMITFNTLISIVFPNVIQNEVTVIQVSQEEMDEIIETEKNDNEGNTNNE
jgi:hypothetical protein